MTEETAGSGTVRRTRSGGEGVLTRHFDHPREAVWALMTTADGIAQWIAPGTFEPHEGGRVHIDFADSGVVIDSTLLPFEPPELLGYSWSSGDEPERPLLWELAEEDGGTRLTLTVTLPQGEDIAKACAGFDAHLDMLAGALEGVPMKFPFETYLAARKAYQAQLGD
ncbi:MAG: SRPBCC family protein [Rubellimicrobium sp.]|nr:SRPBCC family protein [Rubellimicrobium sp.]